MKKAKKREFLKLISPEQAQSIILENFSWSPKSEIKNLDQIKGRILSKDVTAHIDSPPFDRSLMDGFAVRAEDTFDIDETHPKTFRIIDTLPAGKISSKKLLEPMTCIEISTGAPIPSGANAVVMVEYSSKKSKEKVEIFRPVTLYENIDHSGSDIMYGETVLHEGDLLTPVRLGMLAALGIAQVNVKTQLKVGILSSGDELRPVGENLNAGCLYDSNSTILAALVEDTGAIPIRLGICPDDPEIFKQRISSHLPEIDILIISGGTSAGEGDYSYRVITELGGELLFHGVSLKPGKPLAVGIVNDKLIITLPGFPASAIFSFNTVIKPLLHKWTQRPINEKLKIKTLLRQKIRSISGRTQFKLVYIRKEDEYYYAFPITGKSGSVSMLEKADGYIIIPEEVEYLHPDEEVEVTLLREELLLADIVFVGSHDYVIDQLFHEFRLKFPRFHVKQIYTGSTGGFTAMSNSACDIAGVHLLDPETSTYNNTFIDKWQLRDKITLVKGYQRRQGLYVAKGNPKNITGLKDLFRDDIEFLNRNKGSGTRILLDILLENLRQQKFSTEDSINIPKEQINGYQAVAYSHSATASAVARGKVDVSIGIEQFARIFGTEFIPLAIEEYDLLITNKSLEKPAMKELLKIFKSEAFQSVIKTTTE
ncbi:MAG: molybdopterin biosynthesis protein [Candidatus Hodarchaeales archaeon]